MEFILKRLFENREMLSTNIFNIKNHSDESWDLYDKIQDIVIKSCRKLFGEYINVDNSGLDSSNNTEGNRTITYKADVFYFRKDKKISLKDKESNLLVQELKSLVRLPVEDEVFDYSVDVEYSSDQLIIHLRKEEKL